MARARSDKRDRAKMLWEKSNGTKKLKELAMELGVSETQVRKWKSVDSWGKVTLPLPIRKNVTKRKPPKKEKQDKSEVKKRGAPKGNNNAESNKGGKAPKGNKNSVTTGEYENIFFESLTAKEVAKINTMDFDKAKMLQEEITLLTVREIRILERIDRAMESKLIGTGVNSTIHRGSNEEVTGNFTTKNAESSESFLLKLEQSLTNIQDKKARAIESLARIEQGYMRLQLERDIFEWEKGDQEKDNTGINNFIEATKVTEEEMNKLFEVTEVEYEEVK